MAKSTVIYDRIYPRIDEALKQNKNIVTVRQVFGEMISKNNEALSSIVPDKAIYMDARTEKKFFDALNVDPKEIMKALNDSPDISNDWHTVKNPMYISLLLSMIYFNTNKKEDMLQQTTFIFSLYMYRNIS